MAPQRARPQDGSSQRRVLAIFLAQDGRFLCADEVYLALGRRGDRLSMATVQRKIRQLHAQGLLSRAGDAGGRARFRPAAAGA